MENVINKYYILLVFTFLISCTNSEKVNKSIYNHRNIVDFDLVSCVDIDVDSLLSNWELYQCDLYKLVDESCYSEISNFDSIHSIRLIERNLLDSNFIFTHVEKNDCVVSRVKSIPPNQFNLFTYLTENRIINYSVEHKVNKEVNLEELIKKVENNFDPILSENEIRKVLYVIEILNPEYKVFYCIDKLNEAQDSVLKLIKQR